MEHQPFGGWMNLEKNWSGLLISCQLSQKGIVFPCMKKTTKIIPLIINAEYLLELYIGYIFRFTEILHCERPPV